MALIGERRFADALTAFGRALALAPGAAAALLGRGTTLRALGRTAEALADHEAALARDPGNADAWNGRGAFLRSLKRSDEALDSFNRAIALWPDFAESLNNRGDLYWSDRQDYHAAVADLTHALVLDSGRPWLRDNLLHLRMMEADWSGLEQQIALVHDGVRAGAAIVQRLRGQGGGAGPRSCEPSGTETKAGAEPPDNAPVRHRALDPPCRGGL